MNITYSSAARPDATAIAELYRQSPLYRPVDDVDRIARMYNGSNVVLSAWNGETLAGILRGWTDGAFDGYICDLAIHPQYQKLGIARGKTDSHPRTSTVESVTYVTSRCDVISFKISDLDDDFP